jgi:hypothetical protein
MSFSTGRVVEMFRNLLKIFIRMKKILLCDIDGYSVSQKISLTDELTGDEYNKHISDLKEIIIKFNSIKL